MENQSKNTVTINNPAKTGLALWDDNDVAWDDSIFTWDAGQLTITNNSKNASSITNQSKT